MKKMIKLSLVAAVAVAGLTTSASAQKLTDAIQGVDFGGSVEYRMEHRSFDPAASSTNGENLKLVVKGKVKVNDSVTFNALAVTNNQANPQSDATSTTQGSPTVNIAAFTYKTGALSVTAGMQALNTPWTHAADGARANGVLATYGMGSVTLAAAHFRDSQQGIDSNANINSNNASAVAAIGKAGPVGYQVWYMDISDQGNNAAASSSLPSGGDALAVLLNGKIGPVALDASYAYLDGDTDTDGVDSLKKQTLTKLVASMKVGSVKLTAGMADGGKDGDLVTFDSDAKVGFQGWNVRTGKAGQFDASAYMAAVAVPVGATTVSLTYVDAEYDDAAVAVNETDASEVIAQVTYKMSKNFTTYLRYAQVDTDTKVKATGVATSADFDRTRLSLKYTF